MGNFIEIGKDIKAFGLSISNGGTSVLLSVLGLSGSHLAKHDFEKKLIVWLLEHDQTYCGTGCVGFYINEMPWQKEEFDSQKKFMLSVIDNAKNKHSWETLDYEPNQERLLHNLEVLKNMFLSIEPADIDFDKAGNWEIDGVSQDDWENFPLFEKYKMSKDDLRQFPICEKHSILLTIWGCHACNDC